MKKFIATITNPYVTGSTLVVLVVLTYTLDYFGTSYGQIINAVFPCTEPVDAATSFPCYAVYDFTIYYMTTPVMSVLSALFGWGLARRVGK
jgi:hypothetical protein